MAITIDPSVGGSASNSFVTLAEMTTYMEGRLNSDAFDDATADNQNRALAEATRELSALAWLGYRTTDTQALAWPREWVRNIDDPNLDYYDNATIPERVKRATYELALAFLKAGTTDIVSLDTSLNIRSEEIGGAISTSYYEAHDRIKGMARYPAVTREITALLAGQGVTTHVTRG